MYQHRDLLKGCVLKFLMDTFLLLIFRTWNSSNGLDTFLFPENSVDLSVCTYHPDGFVRICPVTMSIDLYPQFSLDLFVDHMNHCLHFSNCCIIFSSSTISLHTFFFKSAYKPQSSGGLTLAVLQLVNGTSYGTDRRWREGERTAASDRIPRVVYKHICTESRSCFPRLLCFLVFWCVHVPVQFAAYHAFIFHSANLAFLTCPCLSRFHCGLFQRLFWYFLALLLAGVPNPGDNNGGLGFFSAVDIMISSGVATWMPQ